MKKLLLFVISIFLWTTPSWADWGNNVGIQGLKYASYATAGTNTIKSSFCFIHTITVTGGTAGAITLYGTGFASPPVVASWSSTNALATYTLDENLASGCTVVTGGNTFVNVSYL